MKKFSKIVESMGSKNYKIEANLELIVESENEGEAGYIADSILGGIEEQFSYNIINIEETTESIKENIQGPTDLTPEEEIEMEWEKEFKDKSPIQTEKMEWYHQMRIRGFDGILIFDVIGDRFSRSED
jgi:hypothetical protein